MAKRLIPIRGNNLQTAEYVGDLGEVTVNIDTLGLVVHDGVTAGGNAQLLQSDLVNFRTNFHSVDGVKNLKAIPNFVQTVRGFHTGSKVGGGQFVFNATRPHSAHDGGLVIAEPALAVYDGTVATLTAFLNWTPGQAGVGCWERLDVGEFLRVSWFGATAGQTVDSAVAITKTCQACVKLELETVYLLPKFALSSTVFVPIGINVIGTGRYSEIVPLGGHTFVNGWMFLINSVDGVNWVAPYPNTLSGGLRNVIFNNKFQVPNCRGVQAWGSCEIVNVRGKYMTQLVKRPTGFYVDNFTVENAIGEPVLGNEYQIEIRGTGDGLLLRGLHFPWNGVNPGDGTPNGVLISATMGGRITDCIGGNVFVTQGTVTFESCHWEKAQLLIDSANVTVKNSVIGGHTKLPVVATSTNVQGHQLVFENVEWQYMRGVLEWTGSDIQVSNRFKVSIRNCHRKWTKQGDLSKSQLTGIQIENSTTTPLTDWNNRSFKLSTEGTIYPNYGVAADYTLAVTDASFPGLTSNVIDAAITWQLPTATYFYKSQLLLDVPRLIGRNQTSSETSIATTLIGSGVRLTCDMGLRLNTGILRLYRGTSSNSYSHYVDLHLCNAYLFYDDGLTVNGQPWISRAGGDVVSLNGLGERCITYVGSNVVVTALTIPTVGSWVVGDRIERVEPTAGGTLGFVNTTTGWKTYGAITA